VRSLLPCKIPLTAITTGRQLTAAGVGGRNSQCRSFLARFVPFIAKPRTTGATAASKRTAHKKPACCCNTTITPHGNIPWLGGGEMRSGDATRPHKPLPLGQKVVWEGELPCSTDWSDSCSNSPNIGERDGRWSSRMAGLVLGKQIALSVAYGLTRTVQVHHSSLSHGTQMRSSSVIKSSSRTMCQRSTEVANVSSILEKSRAL